MNNNQQITNSQVEFEEVEGGVYDIYGCYLLPDGSFWDPNGVYFNRDGLDINGGYYDEDFVYHPGQNWNEELQCYLNPETDLNTLPLDYQEKLMEGIQGRLEQDYEQNKGLFRTSEDKNFDVAEMEIDNQMDIDGEMTDMTLVNSFLNIGNNNGVFQSQKKEKENVNLNSNCFNGISGDNMGEKMGTPFKTKTSEMEQNYSVKKIGTVISPPKSQF